MISLIVPAYNEEEIAEKNLLVMISEMKKTSRALSEKYEIIVSLEGADSTKFIIKKMMKKHKALKLIYSEQRLGKGGGIENGLRAAKGDKIIILDMDLSVHPKVAHDVLRELEKHDIVVTSRYSPTSVSKRSFSRKFLGKSYSILGRMMLGLGVHDTQCGFKGYNRACIENALKYVKHRRGFWDTEMLFYSKKLGYTIGQVPVEWIERREGKIPTFHATIDVFYNYMRLYFRSFFKKYDPVLNPDGFE